MRPRDGEDAQMEELRRAFAEIDRQPQAPRPASTKRGRCMACELRPALRAKGRICMTCWHEMPIRLRRAIVDHLDHGYERERMAEDLIRRHGRERTHR